MEIATLALAGIVSGIVSGMGIGGGVIMIPILTLGLGIPQHTAQGINLLYFIPTALVALCAHVKNKSVVIGASWRVALFGIIGSVAGAIIAGYISTIILRTIFGLFLIFLGMLELYKTYKN